MNPQRPICTMMCSIPSISSIGIFRMLAVVGLAAGLLAVGEPGSAQAAPGASRLPPTAPTASRGGVMSQTTPLAATPTADNTAQRHRARVTYADGVLEVRADNSSLNQILREIARQTGMTIVGGVADQRVFGSYGPGPAATVLKTLLYGTGTNMLLQETATRAPKQLTLTPQTGAAIYPGPASPSFDATESEPELGASAAAQAGTGGLAGTSSNPGAAVGSGSPRQVPAPGTALGPPGPASVPPSMPAPMNNPNGSPNNVSPTAATLPTAGSVPTDSLPTPSTAQPASGIVDAPNPPPAGSTTEGFTGATTNTNPNNPNTPQTTPNPQGATTTVQSPNGVKTPQQVYEQLRQLEQQKRQPSAPAGTQPPQGTTPPQP